jgi:hypothetical protein
MALSLATKRLAVSLRLTPTSISRKSIRTRSNIFKENGSAKAELFFYQKSTKNASAKKQENNRNAANMQT